MVAPMTKPADTPAFEDLQLDPETRAIIAIEQILRDVDEQTPGPANTRPASKRVLAYIAERHKVLGAPGRRPKAQGGT